MSLINQMLKDLEARQRHADPGTGTITPPPARTNIWIKIAGLVMVLGCGAMCGWFLARHHLAASAPQTQAPLRHVVTPPLALPAPVAGEISAPITLPPPVDPQRSPAPTPNTPGTNAHSNIVDQKQLSTTENRDQHSRKPQAAAQPKTTPQPASDAHKPRSLSPAPPAQTSAVDAGTTASTHISRPDLIQRQRLLLDQGRTLYQNGNYPAAVKVLNKGIACASVAALDVPSTPDTIELTAALHQQLTLAHLRLQRLEAALATLENGHRLAPEHIGLHMLYARILLEQSKTSQAATMLEQLPAPAMASQPDFYALRAAIERKAGRLTRAIELYTRLCRLHPERGDWRLGLAISLHQNGDHAAAITHYQSAANNITLDKRLRSFASSRIKLLQQP